MTYTSAAPTTGAKPQRAARARAPAYKPGLFEWPWVLGFAALLGAAIFGATHLDKVFTVLAGLPDKLS